MPITKEQIEEQEAKHGGPDNIAHVKCASKNAAGELKWEAAFRKPTRHEWKLYKRAIHNPAEIATAQEDLAMKCVVIPSRAEFDQLLEKWPAIPEAASRAFDALLGLAVEATGKD